MNSRVAHRSRPACLAASLLIAIAGCANDDDPIGVRRVVVQPELHAVTHPESAATGDSVDLVVHIEVGGCRSTEPIRIETAGDRHLRARVFASDVIGGLCPANVDYASVTARLHLTQAGAWTLDVIGRDTATVVVHVGAAPMPGGRHHFRFEPREPGLSIPDRVQVGWGDFVLPPDSVSVLPDGSGVIPLPCDAGADRRRTIVPRGGSFAWYEFAHRPDDCGAPLRSRFFR